MTTGRYVVQTKNGDVWEDVSRHDNVVQAQREAQREADRLNLLGEARVFDTEAAAEAARLQAKRDKDRAEVNRIQVLHQMVARQLEALDHTVETSTKQDYSSTGFPMTRIVKVDGISVNLHVSHKHSG